MDFNLGRILSRLLTHTHLPGLSSLDQMHLLALADTVSTCNTDFAERFAIDAAKTAIAKENLLGTPQGDDISMGNYRISIDFSWSNFLFPL
jgi:DmX-like protein